jgi:PIN domain nuclease of toxin-antitoxin system
LERADELAVASISWYELARLPRNGRIIVDVPVRSWLEDLSAQIRTIGMTPAIAETAVSLPASFPKDPLDRQIYATAIEHGLKLITSDERMRAHPQPRLITVW